MSKAARIHECFLVTEDTYPEYTSSPAASNGDLCMLSLFSCVWLFATPWTVACQAPLSMGFSRQEYWSELPFPLPGNLPRDRTPVMSPALAGEFFSTSPTSASLVAQSCPTLCNPMDCSTPGFPVHHQLWALAQTHVHRIGDAIQPSHPLSSPSPPAFNLSQHQGLFQWVNSSHQVAKELKFQLQHQSFQWIFRTDFL